MKKILFLSANPPDAPNLRTDREVESIRQRLEAIRAGRRFNLEQRGAVQADKLRQLLKQQKPDILHFSGHANEFGELLLEGNDDHSYRLSIQNARELLAVHRGKISCIVLNACYSAALAGTLIQDGFECVIGMNSYLSDHAAIAFASSFYEAAGTGRSVKQAFDDGCREIALFNLRVQDRPESTTPQLFTAQGFDADQVFLSRPPEIYAKFDLNKNGSLVLKKDGFAITIFVSDVPAAKSVVYQLHYEEYEDEFDEIDSNGRSGFEYSITSLGDIEIRATIWYPDEGECLRSSLIEALQRSHGPNLSGQVEVGLNLIREYKPEEEEVEEEDEEEEGEDQE